jgi:hypothetical protein
VRAPRATILILSASLVLVAATALAQPAGAPRSYLLPGESLGTGKYLVSDNKAFYVTQQGDGNLCVYKGSGPGDTAGYLWCNMKTGANGQYYVTQQGDGNLCVYKGSGPNDSKGYHWCNMKTGAGGQFFTIVQGDGNLCTYRGTGPSDNRGGQWCSGATSAVSWSPPNAAIAAMQPTGTPKVVKSTTPGYDPNFPKNQPCPTDVYTVPAGINYVKITAIGGGGVGGDSTNVVQNIVGIAGLVGGSSANAPSSLVGWAAITGGNGGRGANVSAVYRVTPGQQLYIVAGMSGHQGLKSGRGIYSAGYPGGGYGFHPAGGYSLVSTSKPARTADPNVCAADKASVLMVAGGGGGGGLPAGAGFGGSGGDAGMINVAANAGGDGGGYHSGGGGGGGSQSGGGYVGSHPGCGSEMRSAGDYLRGSVSGGYGGPGGGGLYGGGGGGGGDCFFNTGHAGGGGGSSYVSPAALNARSSVDTTMGAQVQIQPVK